jgi:hypothetical protein
VSPAPPPLDRRPSSGTLALVSEKTPLSIQWIIIGFGVQGGLSWLLPAMLAESLVPPLVEALGLSWGLIAFVVIVALGAFFGGGLLVAYFSPGDTTKEPAIAATLAIAANQAYFLSQEGTQLSVLGIAISVAIAYAFALAGAKAGEKLQGDTTDKMRDRGGLLR